MARSTEQLRRAACRSPGQSAARTFLPTVTPVRLSPEIHGGLRDVGGAAAGHLAGVGGGAVEKPRSGAVKRTVRTARTSRANPSTTVSQHSLRVATYKECGLT